MAERFLEVGCSLISSLGGLLPDYITQVRGAHLFGLPDYPTLQKYMVPTSLDCWRDYNTQVCGAHLFGLLTGLQYTSMWCPPVWTAGGTVIHKYVVHTCLDCWWDYNTQVCGAHLFRLLAGQLLQSGRFDRLLTLTATG